MSTTGHEYVGRALALLSQALPPIVEQTLRPHLLPRMSWADLLAARDEASGRSGGVYREDDVQVLLRLMTESLGTLHRPFDTLLGRTGTRLAGELREIRNTWAHSTNADHDDAYRAVDSTQRLLALVGADDAAEAARDLRREVQLRLVAESAPATVGSSSGDRVPPPQVPPRRGTQPPGGVQEDSTTAGASSRGGPRAADRRLDVPRSDGPVPVPPPPADVHVEIDCGPVISYAMAHNRLNVISEIRLTSRSMSLRGARLTVGITSADGPVGEPREYYVDLAAGAETVVPRLDISADPAAMLRIEEARPAEIVVTVHHSGRDVGRGSTQVLLLAAHQWLAVPTQMSLEMIAAHVQPNHPAITALAQEAAELLVAETGSGSFVGYEYGPDRVDSTVDALAQAMRNRRIRYSLPPASWSDEGQTVRTPGEVLEGRLGTCLDTAVTLAAAMESVGIRPLLVIVTGHAFVGYWREESGLASPATTSGSALPDLVRTDYVAVLETTMLTEDHLDETLRRIRMHPVEEHLTGELHGLVGVTDVHQARRSRILPLPARSQGEDGTIVVTEYQAAHSRPADYVPSRRDEAAGGVRAEVVPPRVQRWKNALLDLSLRNRLINFSDRARFPLHVAEEGLAEFEDVLNSGKPIDLLAADALPEVLKQRGMQRGRDIPADDRIALFRNRRQLYTDATEDASPRVLRSLAHKAKTVIDETGANNLYVAIGSLVWRIKDRTVRSPLILVPVTLKPKGRTGGYQIVLDDAGASTPNYCLLEKLKAEHGLRIPALADPVFDGSGIDVDAVLRETRLSVLASGLDAHVDTSVDLALLQFAKFRLWKDLDENWEALASNELVRHLIETPTEPFRDPAMHAADAVAGVDPDLDGLLTELPVSADASQAAAVAAAAAGRTFVLEGPPGTGKSQTITNLVAKSVRDGKRVLFVAEKRAALDVVHRRLTSAGLGPFTLDLHDKGSKPAALREHLRTSLAQRGRSDRQGLLTSVERMDASRRRLSRYADQLHEPNPSGRSFYASHEAELSQEPGPHLPVSERVAGSLTAEELEGIRRVLRELPDHARRARPQADHPWSFIDPAPGLEVDPERVESAMATLRACLDDAWTHHELSPVVGVARDAGDLTALAAVLRSDPLHPRVLAEIRGGDWAPAAARLRADIQALPARFPDVLSELASDVLGLDLERLRHDAQAAQESGFFGRRKRVEVVAARLAPFLLPGADLDPDSLVQRAERAIELRHAVLSIQSSVRDLSGLGIAGEWDLFHEPNRDYVEQRIAWLTWLASVTDPARALPGAASFRLALEQVAVEDRPARPDLADKVESIIAALEPVVALPGTDRASWDTWAGGRPVLAHLHATGTRRDPESVGGVSARAWSEWCAALAPLRAAGLDAAHELLRTGAVDADAASEAFERGIAEAGLRERARATGLDAFDPVAHGREIERYTSSARAVRGHLPRSIPAELIAARGFDRQTAAGRTGRFLSEIEKQRGRMSVREIMTQYGDLVTALTPCVLVSPDSVARFFPARADQFDIVVFDEASQVRVADAVGAMGRGTSVVVVGDSRQMPPTSFAEATIDDDDEDSRLEDVITRDEESILAECAQARVESRWLSWHYRSQDESLIAFSNRHYYDDQLTSFPAPAHGSVDGGIDGHGISFRRLDGQFLRSGPARTLRTNRVEAEAIVEEIRLRFDASPDETPSVGIVTFNAQQRTLIESLLRDSGDDRIVEALDSSGDGLFVKNLENVQGDERDSILFSIAFSKNDKGILPLNFGPLTNFGGERRLNVAVTRARRQVILFCSFDPSDLRAEETTSRGIRDLRAYLEVAARGAAAVYGSAKDMTTTDRHREEVAEALRHRGAEVGTDVGLSDFKVDLTVASATRPGEPVLAVLLDGPGWAGRGTVADRDALPLEVLAALMKWPAVQRVWLPEWLSDREGVLDRLVASLEAPAATDVEDAPAPGLAAIAPSHDPRDPDALARAGSSSGAADDLHGDTGRGLLSGVPDGAADQDECLPSQAAPVLLGTVARPAPVAAASASRPDRSVLEDAALVIEAAAEVDVVVAETPDDGGPVLPFRSWTPRIAGTVMTLDTLHETSSRDAVVAVIDEVMSAEGPVVEERLAKAVASAFGLGKVHASRQRAILDLVPTRYRHAGGRGVLWPVGVDPLSWRAFRRPDGDAPRPLELVPTAEISNAMSFVATGEWVELESIMRRTIACFGGKRLTASIVDRLDQSLEACVRDGRLEVDASRRVRSRR
ncbi:MULTISPECIES: DUF4011 domain-containing protein [Clavibacter]|uniref:DUF3320 domain-containing protein n=2 Tax=Clavibacter TaxID=1573 RepID=A0A399NW96_9MICO|nr:MULTISPECIES: DUF3320 domain-containing protein [Clavibacter]KDP92238.1 DNA helicase [Clavibacter cf. michiganensis LMG 26808]RII97579.1 DUF3320 domain-containing protein [Clavibacter michiganensis]UKF24574.1 DUF3320 domain-containing protein [Clavibacter sp. A6099]